VLVVDGGGKVGWDCVWVAGGAVVTTTAPPGAFVVVGPPGLAVVEDVDVELGGGSVVRNKVSTVLVVVDDVELCRWVLL
jgi:hypothetical protein